MATQQFTLQDALDLAKKMEAAGKGNKALDLLNQVLAQLPEEDSARLHRATLLQKLRLFSESKLDFERLLLQHPRNARMRCFQAQNEIELGNVRVAETLLN